MVDEFIKLFTGYQGDFGIADMSSAQLDTEKNPLITSLNALTKVNLKEFKEKSEFVGWNPWNG